MNEFNFVPRFDFTNSIHGLSFRELCRECKHRSVIVRGRIRALVKNQNYYSPALVKRYRTVMNIPKQAEVSWEDVIEAASKNNLNFCMTPGQEIKMFGYEYDVNSLTEYYHNVTNFLNSRSSAITGIREYLQQIKTNFGGLLTDVDFESLPEDKQTFALREVLDIMDDLDIYLRENGQSIDNIIADVANNSPLRASMTVSEFVEILRDIAERMLPVSLDAGNKKDLGKTWYKFEEWQWN